MKDIKSLILKNICLAQVASDGGKGKNSCHDIKVRGNKYAFYKGYAEKDNYILKALALLTTSPRCGINFYIEKKPDQNGYASLIAYFDIKIKDERYQVSFHSPYNKSKLHSYVGKGRKTRWTKEVGGSREACIELSKLI